MSKTVIVFSTRYISPLIQDGLFSEGKFKRMVFSSQKLADFFWKDIINSKDYLQLTKNYLLDQFNDCLTKKQKDLENTITKYLNFVKEQITKHNITVTDPTKNYTWIEELYPENIESPFDVIDSKYQNYIKAKSIENYDSLWICENLELKKDAKQESFNLDPAKPNIEGPWLLYRFSYYELTNNDNNISVYAVWPLLKNANNKKTEWIEALTDQFLTDDTEELYLILHDEDIEKSIFKVLDDNKVEIKDDIGNIIQTFNRHIALFQHVDEMGDFLLNPKSSDLTGIKDFIEDMIINARKLKLLRNAYDYIINEDKKALLTSIEELKKLDKNGKFIDIVEKTARISSCDHSDSINHLDELKLQLICQLNQHIIDLMTT